MINLGIHIKPHGIVLAVSVDLYPRPTSVRREHITVVLRVVSPWRSNDSPLTSNPDILDSPSVAPFIVVPVRLLLEEFTY
jgi:hypothetical protein